MKTAKRKQLYLYQFSTAGEILYGRVRHWLFSEVATDHMQEWLGRVNYYSQELQEFVEQALAMWLTARLVAAGKSMQADHGQHYKPELRSYLSEYLVASKQDLEDIARLTADSVEASMQDMNGTVRKQVLVFAQEKHPYCYMCGVRLDFSGRPQCSAFTREHIWPQSLGGDSIIENLLPSCSKCNSKRKANFATWATTSIQSIAVRKAPTVEDWKNLQLSHYYAMHQFAAQSLAIKDKTTLKQSLINIGPWKLPPKIVDAEDVAHFFNLHIT